MVPAIVVLVLLIMAVCAPVVGVDTTDGIDSAEWERRRSWRTPWD